MAGKKPKIYFLGSGAITIPILQTLLAAPELELVGLGSQLDRPAGRKRLLSPTPFAEAAAAMGCAVDKFSNVNAPEVLAYLEALEPDLLLVVSFGQILKEPLLALPRRGCVNIHASLLPKYRGASPIATALYHRDAETGIAYMAMEKGLDTGGIYRLFHFPLTGTERADELERKLGELAAHHAVETLLAIARGECRAQPQPATGVSVCTKIRKSDGRIDWRRPAAAIEAMTRAFHPWPGSSFELRTGERNVLLQLLSPRLLPYVSGDH